MSFETAGFHTSWRKAQLLAQQVGWPSGLRRWLKAPVRKGVGSNPTPITFVILVTNLAVCLQGIDKEAAARPRATEHSSVGRAFDCRLCGYRMVPGSIPGVRIFVCRTRALVENIHEQKMTTVGLEPTISGSVDPRLIHWAKRPAVR